MLKSYLAIFLIGEISLKSEIQIQIKVILEVFNYQSEGGKKSTKNHQANSCNCHFNVNICHNKQSHIVHCNG